MTKRIDLCISMYFVVALLLAPIGLLGMDSYYYWDWSRHLSLSYYDGSPMIAWFIKAATSVFGDTLFALGIVGIIVTALVSRIIYNTARLFLDREASYVSMSLWLFSPLVTLNLLHQTTYDAPLTLFWALTIYYSIKYIKYDRITDFYLIAVSIGLMMLSKYSGIVLVAGLLVFLITSPYRSLFKTRHVYLAALLVLVIFSPVIWWNYQHQWQSFLYQLSTHELPSGSNPLWSVMRSFFTVFLPSLHFFLLPLIICWIKKYYKTSTQLDYKTSQIVYLCLIISTTFLLFYLFTASKAVIRYHWLAPWLVSTSLLAGFCFQWSYGRKLFWPFIKVCALVSLCILLSNGDRGYFSSHRAAWYHLLQQINAYPDLPETVLTSSWYAARPLFFLKNQPLIYTLDCGQPENQYALWSVDIKRQLREKTLKSSLYIDINNQINCVQKYFDVCKQLPTEPYAMGRQKHRIYAWKCSNFNSVQARDTRNS